MSLICSKIFILFYVVTIMLKIFFIFIFQVSILGESFTEIPEIFNKMSALLQSRLLRCGFVQSQRDYYRILNTADVVVSTAIHEFFGAAVWVTSHLVSAYRCTPFTSPVTAILQNDVTLTVPCWVCPRLSYLHGLPFGIVTIETLTFSNYYWQRFIIGMYRFACIISPIDKRLWFCTRIATDRIQVIALVHLRFLILLSNNHDEYQYNIYK